MKFSGIQDVSILIIESDLSDRFNHLIESLTGRVHVASLKTEMQPSILKKLVYNLTSFKAVKLAFNNLPDYITNAKILIISNSEGFIAKNFIDWLKKKNNNIIIVSLQHGIFKGTESGAIDAIKKCINLIANRFFSFQPIGVGFYNSHVDYYIVYNKIYKSKLIECGAVESNIFVAAKILKGFADISRSANEVDKIGIVFMLQPLSGFGMISKSDESELISKIVEWGIRKYNMVYLRQHPYAKVDIAKEVADKCILTNESIPVIASKALAAISYFSESLNELSYYGLKTYAVMSDSIKCDISAYEWHPNIIKIENDLILEKINENSQLCSYYENEYNSLEDIILEIR